MHFSLKNLLSFGLFGLIIGIIVFYAYFQSRALLAGPQINVSEPQNGITTSSALVLIQGTTLYAKEITLQGRQILIDLDGRFAEHLLLAEGYNIIELTARDAQGKQVRKILELVYRAPHGAITP